jgi:hypothetical protein
LSDEADQLRLICDPDAALALRPPGVDGGMLSRVVADLDTALLWFPAASVALR